MIHYFIIIILVFNSMWSMRNWDGNPRLFENDISFLQYIRQGNKTQSRCGFKPTPALKINSGLR
jgi:hypothetical protein